VEEINPYSLMYRRTCVVDDDGRQVEKVERKEIMKEKVEKI
jgi:hypothetical protein